MNHIFQLDVVFGSTNETHEDYILATQNNQSNQTNKQMFKQIQDMEIFCKKVSSNFCGPYPCTKVS
jgi:hypothetical protein